MSIDFQTFCSCSCDKPFSKEICRNDKKVTKERERKKILKAIFQSFMEVNPCADKSSCTECLRDPSCNWCTSPSYADIDGSPLPRCNLHNYFTSGFCPEDSLVNQTLEEDEICDSCEHCAGGVCSENKKV